MTRTDQRLRALEQAGIDTSIYTSTVNSIDEQADKSVEDVQLDSAEFGRKIALKTLRMMKATTTSRTGKHETGIVAYLKNKYSYDYQFKFLKEEINELYKLKRENPKEYAIRSKFFNCEVITETCDHFLLCYQLEHYYSDRKTIALMRHEVDIAKKCTHITDIQWNYGRFLKMMKTLHHSVPKEEYKCVFFKDAYIGMHAYYTLQNLILFHNCLLPGTTTTKESLKKLNDCLEECSETPLKKRCLYTLLEQTICDNDVWTKIQSNH